MNDIRPMGLDEVHRTGVVDKSPATYPPLDVILAREL